MTLNELYHTAYQRCFSKAQEDSCAFDLSVLFEHVLGVSRYRLPIVGDQPASEQKAKEFLHLCDRYTDGYPLQYLIGEWEFYGLRFKIGEGVLIPRPDTELLVETALKLIQSKHNPVIADLCAGSGCVAAAIAHERPDARVYALELSEQAFSYLTENIVINDVQVHAVPCDVFDPPPLPPLDLVVSNPPYIPDCEMRTLQKQVTFEPKMALYGGEDGYDFYRQLPKIYAPRLTSKGAIAFETGYNQAQNVANLLSDSQFCNIKIEKDLAGIERVVYGQIK